MSKHSDGSPFQGWGRGEEAVLPFIRYIGSPIRGFGDTGYIKSKIIGMQDIWGKN